MKSFIRWAGSKRQLIHRIKPFWTAKNHIRYIEPFCGSACLFFDLLPSKALLADLNTELINAYRTIKATPSLVVDQLKSLPRGKRAYYSIRNADMQSLTRVERAARFLYLNRYCFNGIYRTNLAGKFNVPYAPPKGSADFDYSRLSTAATALRRARFTCADFEETLKVAKKGDFVYLDPPYAVSKRRVFAEYGASSFGLDDLDRLRKCLISLDKRNVSFVISYADSQEARKLLRRWNPKRIRTRRFVSGFAEHRRSAYEVLASNILLSDAD